MIGAVVQSGKRVGVVIAARPKAEPRRVKVAWQPLEAGVVGEYAWPPENARVLQVLNTTIAGRVPRPQPAAVEGVEEPIGFAEFLGAHVAEAKRVGVALSVPGAGTTRRAQLAKTFAKLIGEGESVERLKAASVGVLEDAYMREHGHVDPENVLRAGKVGRRADAGERVLAQRASQDAGDTTNWGQFDA